MADNVFRQNILNGLGGISFLLFLTREVYVIWSYDPSTLKTENRWSKTIIPSILYLFGAVFQIWSEVRKLEESFSVFRASAMLLILLGFCLELVEDFYKRFKDSVPNYTILETVNAVAVAFFAGRYLLWSLAMTYNKYRFREAARDWTSTEAYTNGYTTKFVIFSYFNPISLFLLLLLLVFGKENTKLSKFRTFLGISFFCCLASCTGSLATVRFTSISTFLEDFGYTKLLVSYTILVELRKFSYIRANRKINL